MTRLLLPLSALLALALACGDDDGTTTPDAGPMGDDGGMPDAGPEVLDETPPRVTTTRPRPMAEAVSRTSAIDIRFSEPVVSDSGTLVVSGPDGDLSASPDWAEDRESVTLRPDGEWPGGARVAVEVASFVDDAGNVQLETYELVFHTSDEGAPELTSSSPAEGEADVATDEVTVSLVFSEPMNPVLGVLELVGEGDMGDPAWSSETELRVTLSNLRPDTAYRLRLEGFEDRSGNLLDPEPYLVNGVLDFTTVADTTAPTLVDSNPTHEQLDVQVGRLRAIDLELSEPMDTSIRTVSYSAGSTVGILTGNWSADGRTLSFPTRGRVQVDAEHRIDLSSLRDESGNALDGSVGLDEGELVFTTSSADAVIPFVVFSAPTEGATDTSTRTEELRILFSEAMDTSIVEVTLTTGGEDFVYEGVWNEAGTELSVPLDGLRSAASYMVDLTGFADLSGNLLDDTHPYLGDAVLDFETGSPTGETCRDPLTTMEATADGDAFVWDLAGGAFEIDDDNPSCRGGFGTVPDGVIVYEKTTDDIASGGSAIHLTVRAPDAYDGVQLEVYRDVCDREAVGGGDVARVTCLEESAVWDQYLDVPAGTYYVWVANEDDFVGANVRIEEVDSIPEGESCLDPYTATSSIHEDAGTDADRWVVPGFTHHSLDYGASADAGSMECNSTQGPDAVIEIDKARAGSILDVAVESFPADTGSDFFDRAGTKVSVTNQCAFAPERDELACSGRIRDLESFQVQADAGTYYLWLAANNTQVPMQRTTVTVTEIDPEMGETCVSAIPLTPGTSNAVTPDATTAYFRPSCVDDDDHESVTWYRYTTTEELSVVTLEGTRDPETETPIAFVDANDGSELACLDEGIDVSVPQRAPAGTEYCIAVPTSAAITGITIEEMPWQGIDGSVRTELNITRPLDDDGDERRITGDAWMAITPTQLYMGVSVTSSISAGILSAPIGGDARADFIEVDRYQIGNGGAAVGEALWSVDESDSSTRPERLFRLLDSVGASSATPWDTGSSYVAADIDTLTRILGEDLFLMVSDQETGDPTTFYTVPTTTPQAATPIGTNDELADVVALAANDEWIFVAGDGPEGSSDNTVFRVPRDDVGATPERLAPADLVGFSSSNGAMSYDEANDILYFRSTSSPAGIYAIFGAGSDAPLFAGAVAIVGRSFDYAMAFDAASESLYVFETESTSDGNFVVIQ